MTSKVRKIINLLSELSSQEASTKITLKILRNKDIDSSELFPLDIISNDLLSCSNKVLIELIKENIEVYLGPYSVKAQILQIAMDRLSTCK